MLKMKFIIEIKSNFAIFFDDFFLFIYLCKKPIEYSQNSEINKLFTV